MSKPATSTPTFVDFVTKTLDLPLSPAQLALASVCFDGAPIPEEYAHMFGGLTGSVPASARTTIAWLCGRASGKTRMLALYILWRLLYASLPKLARGEIGFGVVFSPTLELSEQTLRIARGALEGTRYERAIIGETKSSFTIMRPDGQRVRFTVLAAKAKGTAGRGRTLVAAALDEACFFAPETAGVVNDADVYRALPPRLVEGGAIVIASTPWTQTGLLHEYWSKQFGKPETALVAVAPTEVMRSDDSNMVAMVERERQRDPDNAAREFDCEWLAVGAGSAFDPEALKRAVTDAPPREDGTIAIAGDIGVSSDPSAFIAARIHGDGSVTVLDTREYRPRKGQPIHVASMMRDVAVWAERLGAGSTVRVDRHSLAEVQQIIERDGIPLRLEPVSEGPDRERRFRYASDLFAAGRVSIPKEHAHLTEQLALIVSTPREGGGYKFSAPRRDGHHCDLAMAFVLVCEGALSLATFQGAMQNTQALEELNLILAKPPEGILEVIAVQREAAFYEDNTPARAPTETDREQCRATFAAMREFMQRPKCRG